ncbi:MAG TPA: hypothetical protein PKE26_15690 [Kiritimatiellia bacterium]|nr:hypothetical protein [Kiritimatiellia bacterium]HMP00538.1 hypothetical protein [Kiritimatiellia bacterium]
MLEELVCSYARRNMYVIKWYDAFRIVGSPAFIENASGAVDVLRVKSPDQYDVLKSHTKVIAEVKIINPHFDFLISYPSPVKFIRSVTVNEMLHILLMQARSNQLWNKHGISGVLFNRKLKKAIADQLAQEYEAGMLGVITDDYMAEQGGEQG